MTNFELNEAVLEAVADHDIRKIQQCLQQGANILYVHSLKHDHGLVQPVNVLSMVMFKLADNMLDPPDFLAFEKITSYL
jgi:hypothetical protein